MGVIQDYLAPSNFDRPPKGQPAAPKPDKKKKGDDEDDAPKPRAALGAELRA